MEKYSVNTFKQVLKEETQNICSDFGWDWNNNVHRGYSFQIWMADLISTYEQSYETEVENAVLRSKDLKSDIFFEDSTNKQLLICQCKFTSLSKLKPLNEDEIVSFFQKIIQFNNSQNAIKVSDFRSNDTIQLWIESKFEEQRSTEVLKNLRYIRKRTFKRVHGQIGIKLEDFAKIRYSFLKEPTKCLSQPRALWTSEEDGGVYEIAFGVNGKIEPHWSDEDFKESLLAIAFYFKFLDVAKEIGRKSDDFKYLNRLKWHAVTLAGIYRRDKATDMTASQILNNCNNFDTLWDSYWEIAKVILDEVYTRAMEDKTTLFAFVRSMERWERMKLRMNKRILM